VPEEEMAILERERRRRGRLISYSAKRGKKTSRTLCRGDAKKRRRRISPTLAPGEERVKRGYMRAAVLSSVGQKKRGGEERLSPRITGKRKKKKKRAARCNDVALVLAHRRSKEP